MVGDRQRGKLAETIAQAADKAGSTVVGLVALTAAIGVLALVIGALALSIALKARHS